MSNSFKKVYQTPQKYGLAIDWETSGADWNGDSSKSYQGLSFGAIVFDTDTFEPIESMYQVIKFNSEKWKWTVEAEAIHGMSREFLEEHGVEAADAAVELCELILKYFGPKSKVMLLGHNVEFDRRFTNQLLNEIDFEFSVQQENPEMTQIQLHHVMLDTSSLGFFTLGAYKSDLLFQSLGFEDRGQHNALQDIEQTLTSARMIKEIFQTGWQVILGEDDV